MATGARVSFRDGFRASSRADGSFEVTLAGPLTGREALELTHDLDDLPCRHFEELVVDVEAVTAIDASGVVALVRLYAHMTSLGKRLALAGASETLVEVLRRAGLTPLIAVVAPVRELAPTEVREPEPAPAPAFRLVGS